jgi:hypothetical protein
MIEMTNSCKIYVGYREGKRELGRLMLRWNDNNVAYRPVAKRQLFKQRPLLGSASNIHARNNRRTVISVIRTATVAMQRRCIHASKIEGLCFLRGPCQGVILKTTGATQLGGIGPPP